MHASIANAQAAAARTNQVTALRDWLMSD